MDIVPSSSLYLHFLKMHFPRIKYYLCYHSSVQFNASDFNSISISPVPIIDSYYCPLRSCRFWRSRSFKHIVFINWCMLSGRRSCRICTRICSRCNWLSKQRTLRGENKFLLKYNKLNNACPPIVTWITSPTIVAARFEGLFQDSLFPG